MMLVDDRVGSREFKKPLARLGIPVKELRLQYGDFRWRGWWHDDSAATWGVERKTVTEILDAITDNRFTGRQLPGMLRTYRVPILIVEGFHKPDPTSGLLVLGRGREAGYGYQRHLFENYQKFLCTVLFKAKLHVIPSSGKIHTRFLLAALYRWSQKRWKDHKSVYTVDETKVDAVELAIAEERLLKRRVFAQLPGVGWVRSAKVEQHFESIHAGMVGSVAEWNAALGIRDGKKTAKRIVAAIAEVVEDERSRRGAGATRYTREAP